LSKRGEGWVEWYKKTHPQTKKTQKMKSWLAASMVPAREFMQIISDTQTQKRRGGIFWGTHVRIGESEIVLAAGGGDKFNSGGSSIASASRVSTWEIVSAWSRKGGTRSQN